MTHRRELMQGISAALLALGLWLPCARLHAGIFIIEVPRDYTNINAAIAAAGPNGQVVIGPGVYDRSSQTFPIVVPFNLILKGKFGTHQTVIDGTGHDGPLIRAEGMNSYFFGLSDFTLRHATNTTSDSAALHLFNCSRMTVSNLRFFNNAAPAGAGAGLLIQDSVPRLFDLEFRENSAQGGAAVSIEGAASAPEFSRCTFIGNTATSDSGALLIRGDATATLDSCLFESNTAGLNGGAIHASSTTGLALGAGPEITNTRFYKNTANNAGAIFLTNHRLLAQSCEFLENDGTTNGGAVITDGASRLDMDRCHAGRNTSGQHIFVVGGAGDITNSMFYRNTTQNGGILRFEGAAVSARVVHNTFAYNNVGGPIATTGAISHNGGTPLFQNNIVAFNDAIGYAETNFVSDPIFRYNLFWQNTEGGYLDEGVSILNTPAQFLVIANPQPAVGMVIADPEFRDEGVNNFHLNPTSPAINAGQTVAGIAALDIDLDDRALAAAAGAAPDMGADEQLAPIVVTSAFWFDKFFNGFTDAGDELVLQFSEPVELLSPLTAGDFDLPVAGDSLGTTITALVNAENPTQLVITLSAGAFFTPPGTFSDTTVTSGSASGIELIEPPRAGVLVSARTGLDARRALDVGKARDITVSLEPNNFAFTANPGFQESLQVGPSGYFTKNRLDAPAGSLLYPTTLLLAPRFEFAGALSAMHISQVTGVVVIHPDIPVKLTMEYEPQELNAESDEFEKRLRIFVRRQNIFGQYEFQPVVDSRGGIQQVDTVNNTISVYTDDLIPQDIAFGAAAGSGETAVQANTLALYLIAPLPVMPVDSALISPAAVVIEPSKPLALLPEVYYNHRLDLPNFNGNPASIRGATLQTAANRFEREEFERTGQPALNFALAEVISWENDPANRVEFLDTADLRLQYHSHPEIDLRDSRGYTASPYQLDLLQYDAQTGFAPPASGSALLTAQSNTLTISSLLNPAPDGRGIYALIANAAAPFAYTFNLGEEGWRRQDAPRFFLTPDFIAGSGRIGLGSRGLNTFGAWLSPENLITAQPDQILKTRFTISSTHTNPALVPATRLRLNSENLDSALVMQLISDPSGVGFPASGATVDYLMFYEPPRTAIGAPENVNGVGAAFDLTHFDPFDNAFTWIYLEHFETEFLDKKTFDAGFTLAKDYTFLFGADGWVSSGQIGQMTAPIAGYDAGRSALFLQAADVQTFGFWTVNSGIVLQPGMLYRVTFWIFSNVGSNGFAAPTLRVRVSDGISATQTLEVNSATGGMSPLTVAQPYQVYYYPPADVATTGRSIILGFDILNFNPDDSTFIRLFLDRVTIEQKAY